MNTDTRNALGWERLAAEGAVPILLIRHAQTAWNVQGRFLGRSDVPLDADGAAQAQALARRLAVVPLSALYASPLGRAWETARAVVGAHPELTPEPVAALTELNQGDLEGQPGRALIERYPGFLERWRADPTDVRVPGGETLGECRDRAVAAVHDLAARHAPGPPLAIVTHKMVLATLACEAIGLPLRQHHLVGQLNTAINLYALHDGRLVLHRLNDAAHLKTFTHQ